MKWSNLSPEELEAENWKSHVSRQKRSKDAIEAVKEMSKRPLSLEQKKLQVERNRRLAERLDRLEMRELKKN